LSAHRGLRYMQHSSCPSEAELLGDRNKVAEMTKFHAKSDKCLNHQNRLQLAQQAIFLIAMLC
jgi:hypothetical protein